MVPGAPGSDPAGEVDLNQVVAYNVREARELRGWTQEEFAIRLEPYVGQRLTQAGVSSIERAWDGERKREFDAHELLIFSLVFDLPMIWFLLPPPGDHRMMRATPRPVNELYAHLLGMPHQLEPLYAKLRQLGIANPEATDAVFQLLTGNDTSAHRWSYRERRRELLLALLDQQADAFDTAVEDLGRIVDRLRQIGIRGFLAETTNDRDLGLVDVGHGVDETAAVNAVVDRATPAGTAASSAKRRTAAAPARKREPARREPPENGRAQKGRGRRPT